MTEHSDSIHQTNQSGDRPPETSKVLSSITLNLPGDLASMVERHCQQSDQTTGEGILTLLRSALELPISQSSASAINIPPLTAAALETILERLATVEALIPRLEALEGKSIAF